jgi:hypothetical protein
MTDMRNSGSLILGYVGAPTTKNLTTAKAEVSKYFTWYPGISGIFFDQASSICTAANLDYYGQLVAYVRSFNPSAVVAMNWGAGEGLQTATAVTHVLRSAVVGFIQSPCQYFAHDLPLHLLGV